MGLADVPTDKKKVRGRYKYKKQLYCRWLDVIIETLLPYAKSAMFKLWIPYNEKYFPHNLFIYKLLFNLFFSYIYKL